MYIFTKVSKNIKKTITKWSFLSFLHVISPKMITFALVFKTCRT